MLVENFISSGYISFPHFFGIYAKLAIAASSAAK